MRKNSFYCQLHIMKLSLFKLYLHTIIIGNKVRKIYFYTKKRKEYLPFEDEEANTKAKQILENIRENLNLPTYIINDWDNVYLCSTGTIVEKAKSLYIKSLESTFDLKNTLNDLTAKEWLTETVTVFAQKGLGASNKDAQIEKLHPAPYSFQDVARLIRFYSKEGSHVLDPFGGVGSTAKACAYENRRCTSIELNPKYHELSIERILKEVPDDYLFKNKQTFLNGDSSKLIKTLPNDSFDFIVTSPPYWNILETIDHKSKERLESNLDTKYSDSDDDMANIEDYNDFLDKLCGMFDECHKILKKGKYMCIVVSDFRKKDRFHLFHADIAYKLENLGHFRLKGVRILHQRHKSIYPYGYPFTFVPNIHHQNVLIFENIK
ncbi:DNA methyltransferase [Faecalibacter sp. LW9]|uniref:DNA methyltransferase n=1 Tax=Faecalibacter sp. LW9 TaxID=3103144 RepID=UPI002AFF7173|nr:DNA methyltransferase [Faecalibacter sp. LW9]